MYAILGFFLVIQHKKYLMLFVFSDSSDYPSQNFHRAGLLEGQQSAILKHIVWVCKAFSEMEFKWETANSYNVVFLLRKSLILLLEQLDF